VKVKRQRGALPLRIITVDDAWSSLENSNGAAPDRKSNPGLAREQEENF
jgi:hypothetical protein